MWEVNCFLRVSSAALLALTGSALGAMLGAYAFRGKQSTLTLLGGDPCLSGRDGRQFCLRRWRLRQKQKAASSANAPPPPAAPAMIAMVVMSTPPVGVEGGGKG